MGHDLNDAVRGITKSFCDPENMNQITGLDFCGCFSIAASPALRVASVAGAQLSQSQSQGSWWAKAGLYPGQVDSLSQGRIERQTTIHTHTHTHTPTASLEFAEFTSRTFLWEEAGQPGENLEGTLGDTETCTL